MRTAGKRGRATNRRQPLEAFVRCVIKVIGWHVSEFKSISSAPRTHLEGGRRCHSSSSRTVDRTTRTSV